MPRLESVNILRIIGAILITVYHMDFQSAGIQPVKQLFLGSGNFSVALFIVISGFLNAYNDKIDRVSFRGIVANTKKRVSKVYPLHIVSLLAVLAYKFVTHSFESTDGIALPLNVLLLQGFVPIRSIYYSFNKLSWYLTLYLLFSIIEIPLVYVIKRMKVSKRFVLFVCIVAVELIWITIFQDSSNVHWFCYVCPWFRTLDYVLGVIAGSVFVDYGLNIKAKIQNKPAVLYYIGLLVLIFACIASKTVIPKEYYKVFYSISCCCCLYICALLPLKASPSVVKCIGLMGLYSFDWYLIHQIVIGVITQVIKNELLAFAVVIICTAIAVLVWEKLYSLFKKATSRLSTKNAG